MPARLDLRRWLPAAALLAVMCMILLLQPRVMSYFGFTLLLNLALPIVLVTMAQVCLLAVNDLDLSIGSFVSLVACIGATWLHDDPVFGTACLLGCVAAYALLGALIHLRRLPSIVVTLGMSFVWLGAAILALPSPGGKASPWLAAAVGYKPPLVPLPILAALLIGVGAQVGLMRTSYGTILRGFGGNAVAIRRADWSALGLRVAAYALAGGFGVLSGLCLLGITTSADSSIALRYTLLSIAGAILGGCEFTGGRVAPFGAMLGAITIALAGSALTFMQISTDWQIGAQGAVLIAVLGLRAMVQRGRPA